MTLKVAVRLSVLSGVYLIVPKAGLEKIARMQNFWLGEIAFVNYWRVLEAQCPGVVKAPEFSHMSFVERQAWVEAAKAVGEQIHDSFCVASSK